MARLLYLGCEPGLDVLELQDCLNNACLAVGESTAFAALKPDGMFGPKTQSRVLEFQRLHKLNPDGVVGTLTWAALEAVLCTVAGLSFNRPLGGGGNPGIGTGTGGGKAHGKPESGNADAIQDAVDSMWETLKRRGSGGGKPAPSSGGGGGLGGALRRAGEWAKQGADAAGGGKVA